VLAPACVHHTSNGVMSRRDAEFLVPAPSKATPAINANSSADPANKSHMTVLLIGRGFEAAWLKTRFPRPGDPMRSENALAPAKPDGNAVLAEPGGRRPPLIR
jgi:hypothetical protein